MTSVLDNSGKLISQATRDESMTHTPTRRDNKRRSASRRKAPPALPPQPEQPQQQDSLR
jgi:hypothetical protein